MAAVRTRSFEPLYNDTVVSTFDGGTGLVSLSVVASTIVVALGLQVGDPIIGLIITLVILRITWRSAITVQRDPGSELANAEAPSVDDGPRHGGHGHGPDKPVAERG